MVLLLVCRCLFVWFCVCIELLWLIVVCLDASCLRCCMFLWLSCFISVRLIGLFAVLLYFGLLVNSVVRLCTLRLCVCY